MRVVDLPPIDRPITIEFTKEEFRIVVAALAAISTDQLSEYIKIDKTKPQVETADWQLWDALMHAFRAYYYEDFENASAA